jgi:hypothetical protein
VSQPEIDPEDDEYCHGCGSRLDGHSMGGGCPGGSSIADKKRSTLYAATNGKRPFGPCIDMSVSMLQLRLAHSPETLLTRRGLTIRDGELSRHIRVDIGTLLSDALERHMEPCMRVKVMRQLGVALRPFCPEAADALDTYGNDYTFHDK